MGTTTIQPASYYRLPWTLTDNVLGWLEPTKRCNLYCEGCYSRNDPDSDKSLEQIREDLDVFVSKRRMDSMSIAGGDPLVHPDIVEIVRMIHTEYGLKPVLNTNGLALTPELLAELKEAGVFGFTFHIDSSQHRPGHKDKDEIELNELRLHYARMVAEQGLSVSFNATIFRNTMHHVPALMKWASDNIDVVHNMVFILFRTTRSREFNYYAQGQEVPHDDLVYYDEDENPEPVTATELVELIRKEYPDYDPCAYLGGTKDPDSFKWLLGVRLGDGDQVYGYAGRRFIEAVQTGHHLLRGRYLAYSKPSLLRQGKALMASASAWDRGIRRAARNYTRALATQRWRLARKPVHVQSILIIQPIDMMADGQANMCDGCPDMVVHNGELMWSCRLDEQTRYGCFLDAAPKNVTATVEETVKLPTNPKPRRKKKQDPAERGRAQG